MNICMVGTGYVGLVTGACLADFGMNVVCVDKDADKIAALQRGQMPIYEPGLEEVVARNERAGRLRFTTDLKTRHRGRARDLHRRRHAAEGRRLARPDVRPPGRRGDRRAHERLQGRRDEVHRADRHGPDDRADPRRQQRPPRVLGRVQPRVPARGLGGRRLPAARPRRHRRRRRARDRGPEGDLQPALPDRDAVRDHRRRLGRAHQVRLQRLPRREDLLHQRDRAAVRAHGRRRPRRGARAWASTAASAASSCIPGPGFGGSCFPKDTAAAADLARQHGYTLRDHRGDDAGQRRDEGAHDREDRGRRGPARRQDRRRPRPLLQARDRRHPRVAGPRRGRGPARRRAPRCAPSIRRRWPTPGPSIPDVHYAEDAYDCADGRRLPRPRHRVERVPGARPRTAWRPAPAVDDDDRPAQRLRARRKCGAAAGRYAGVGRG